MCDTPYIVVTTPSYTMYLSFDVDIMSHILFHRNSAVYEVYGALYAV